MSEEKLRNCPFCNKTEPLDIENNDWQFRVVCNVHGGGCGASSGYYKTMAEAISAWNRRKRKRVVDANKTITCFKCHGAGVFGVPYLNDNGEWDGRLDARKCEVCGHTGKITLALYEKWQKRMREDKE